MKRKIFKLIMFLIPILIAILCASCGQKRIAVPQIEAEFSPEGKISDKIINYINSSKSSIDIAMYNFTKRDIAWALVDAHNRGIKVRILLDGASSFGRSSKCIFFKKKNMDVKIYNKSMMHNKFAIIDRSLLITGSYNWTARAERSNRENILFIKEAPEIIKKYDDEFENMWNSSEEAKIPEVQSPDKQDTTD